MSSENRHPKIELRALGSGIGLGKIRPKVSVSVGSSTRSQPSSTLPRKPSRAQRPRVKRQRGFFGFVMIWLVDILFVTASIMTVFLLVRVVVALRSDNPMAMMMNHEIEPRVAGLLMVAGLLAYELLFRLIGSKTLGASLFGASKSPATNIKRFS